MLERTDCAGKHTIQLITLSDNSVNVPDKSVTFPKPIKGFKVSVLEPGTF